MVDSAYVFVGESSKTRKRMLEITFSALERAEVASYFHVTRLAYAFPLAALVLWLVLIIVNR